MTRRHVLSFTIFVRSPFIFAGVEASAVGVDTSALRDEKGRPILPGDHLKGLLHQAARTLEQTAPGVIAGNDLDQLFGQWSEADLAERERRQTTGDPFMSFAPKRSDILFDDLVAEKMRLPPTDAISPKLRRPVGEWEELAIAAWEQRARDKKQDAALRHTTRIKIDHETGIVASGMLQVIELAAPLAAVAEFEGDAILYAADDTAEKITALLAKALKLVPYFGGLRSAGFGEHVAEAATVVRSDSRDIVPAAPSWTAGERFEIEGFFDRPFLVNAERAGNNIFVGDAVVPGGVIKGALADLLRRAGRNPESDTLYGRTLSRLRISHAFPLSGTAVMGRALPFSAMYDRTSYACAFAAKTPGLIDGNEAAFLPAWKSDDGHEFAKKVGRPQDDLPFRPRGHTSIDPATGVAEDEALFVEVARGALDNGQSRRFRFTVDFGAVAGLTSPDEQAAVQDMKAILTSGLDTIGKTRARLSVVSRRACDPLPAEIPGKQADGGKRRWRILLEAAGLLIDPDDPNLPERDEGGRVTSELNAYFAEVVPGAALRAHYAQRQLVGAYQARRHRLGRGQYHPHSLFAPGSCFLLEATEADAGKLGRKLAVLAREGLPVMRREGTHLVRVDDWRECPYLLENGYGAISVESEVFDKIGTAADDAVRNGETAL